MQVQGARAAAVAVLASVGLLAACGPAAPDRVAGRTPRQVALAAQRAAAALSYRAAGTVVVGLDTAGLQGLTAADQAGLARLGSSLSLTYTLVRAARDQAELTVAAPALGLATARVVLSGRTLYVQPGGATWYETTRPATATGAGNLHLGRTLAAAATQLVALSAVGPATIGGIATEHFQGAASGARITQFLTQAVAGIMAARPSSAASSAALDALVGAIGTPSIAVDTWVARSTGRLAQLSMRLAGSLDLTQIVRTVSGLLPPSGSPSPAATPTPATTPAASPSSAGGAGLQLPTGSLGLTVSLTTRWSDYGAALRVAVPATAKPLRQLMGMRPAG